MSKIFDVRWLPKPNNVELSFDTIDFDENLVCSVFGFFFDGDRNLLMIQKDRGWDVPGGGKEILETPRNAIIRETMEEAMVRVDNVHPVAINKITIDLKAVPNDYWRPFPISYEIYYVGHISKTLRFVPNDETTSRNFFTFDDALQQEGIMFGFREEILRKIKNASHS